jgi:ferredoxin
MFEKCVLDVSVAVAWNDTTCTQQQNIKLVAGASLSETKRGECTVCPACSSTCPSSWTRYGKRHPTPQETPSFCWLSTDPLMLAAIGGRHPTIANTLWRRAVAARPTHCRRCPSGVAAHRSRNTRQPAMHRHSTSGENLTKYRAYPFFENGGSNKPRTSNNITQSRKLRWTFENLHAGPCEPGCAWELGEPDPRC